MHQLLDKLLQRCGCKRVHSLPSWLLLRGGDGQETVLSWDVQQCGESLFLPALPGRVVVRCGSGHRVRPILLAGFLF